MSNHVKPRVRVNQTVTTLLGWPTDTFSVYFEVPNTDEWTTIPAHTVLVFVPGNPGLIEWYIPFFQALIGRLGPGFAARGAANAGHALDVTRADVQASENEDKSIPWTVDGQVLHKIAFIDIIAMEYSNGQQSSSDNDQRFPCSVPKWIFVSHSIGAHFTQRVCLMRPDILRNTCLLIHLMPFIRMHAPKPSQLLLDFLASQPDMVISAGQGIGALLQALPISMLEHVLLRRTVEDPVGRNIAANLVRNPTFVKNFFSLGLEEVRDVPEVVDVAALCVIKAVCPITMLYAGKSDHWGPPNHVKDLEQLQLQDIVPPIDVRMDDDLQHDFVTVPCQVGKVVDFCYEYAFQSCGNLKDRWHCLSRI